MLSPREMATLLLKTGCVQVSVKRPFTYASGLQGPIYCDNRLLLGEVGAREKVVSSLLGLIEQHDLQFDHLAGLATAGIPYAAWLAHDLKRPMLYIRGQKKGHGKSKQVEGPFRPQAKALLIEDLVNQASSLEEASLGGRQEGLVITDVLCLVDYQMSAARERLNKLALNLYSLTTFEVLMNAAQETGMIEDHEQELLRSWQKDPANWLVNK